jgi:hypothetical protein
MLSDACKWLKAARKAALAPDILVKDQDMSRAAAQTSNFLFSDRLKDASVQSQTRRIFARNTDSFRSNVFRPALDGKTPDETMPAYWLEAARTIDDNWTVKRYTTVSQDILGAAAKPQAGEMPPSRDQTIVTGACFFDALYFCAEFEKGEESFGNVIDGKLTALLKQPHIGAAQAAEFMPTDLSSNMPAPAGNGAILIEGIYSGPDREAVLQTRENMREANLPAISGKYHVATSGSGATRALELFNQNGGRRELVYDISQRSRRLSDALDFSMSNGFNKLALYTRPLVKVGSTWALSLGVAAACGTPVWLLATCWGVGGLGAALFTGIYCEDLSLASSPGRNGSGHGFPHRRFNKELQSFNRRVAQLPDSALKTDLTKMSDEMILGYKILNAREAFRMAAEKGSFLRNIRKRNALKHFIAVAAQQELSETETIKCLALIENNPKDRSADFKLASVLIGKGMESENALNKVSREQANDLILKGLPNLGKNNQQVKLPSSRSGGLHVII